VSAGGAPLDVRTRFERFPLAIKGAFVMRGADGNPHAARVVEAAVARVPSGPRAVFPVEDRIVDVAPNRDLFVPFEAPVTDLPSGWYVISSAVEIDGRRPVQFASRPFTVPWARADVRRGTLRVDAVVEISGSPARLLRLEMGPDTAGLVWEAPGSDPDEVEPRLRGALSVLVDGSPLDVLPQEVRAGGLASAHDERVLRTYPVPRGARALDVVVAQARHDTKTIRIPLA
jgi:hypothetical protein